MTKPRAGKGGRGKASGAKLTARAKSTARKGKNAVDAEPSVEEQSQAVPAFDAAGPFVAIDALSPRFSPRRRKAKGDAEESKTALDLGDSPEEVPKPTTPGPVASQLNGDSGLMWVDHSQNAASLASSQVSDSDIDDDPMDSDQPNGNTSNNREKPKPVAIPAAKPKRAPPKPRGGRRKAVASEDEDEDVEVDVVLETPPSRSRRGTRANAKASGSPKGKAGPARAPQATQSLLEAYFFRQHTMTPTTTIVSNNIKPPTQPQVAPAPTVVPSLVDEDDTPPLLIGTTATAPPPQPTAHGLAQALPSPVAVQPHYQLQHTVSGDFQRAFGHFPVQPVNQSSAPLALPNPGFFLPHGLNPALPVVSSYSMAANGPLSPNASMAVNRPRAFHPVPNAQPQSGLPAATPPPYFYNTGVSSVPSVPLAPFLLPFVNSAVAPDPRAYPPLPSSIVQTRASRGNSGPTATATPAPVLSLSNRKTNTSAAASLPDPPVAPQPKPSAEDNGSSTAAATTSTASEITTRSGLITSSSSVEELATIRPASETPAPPAASSSPLTAPPSLSRRRGAKAAAVEPTPEAPSQGPTPPTTGALRKSKGASPLGSGPVRNFITTDITPPDSPTRHAAAAGKGRRPKKGKAPPRTVSLGAPKGNTADDAMDVDSEPSDSTSGDVFSDPDDLESARRSPDQLVPGPSLPINTPIKKLGEPTRPQNESKETPPEVPVPTKPSEDKPSLAKEPKEPTPASEPAPAPSPVPTPAAATRSRRRGANAAAATTTTDIPVPSPQEETPTPPTPATPPAKAPKPTFSIQSLLNEMGPVRNAMPPPVTISTAAVKVGTPAATAEPRPSSPDYSSESDILLLQVPTTQPVAAAAAPTTPVAMEIEVKAATAATAPVAVKVESDYDVESQDEELPTKGAIKKTSSRGAKRKRSPATARSGTAVPTASPAPSSVEKVESARSKRRKVAETSEVVWTETREYFPVGDEEDESDGEIIESWPGKSPKKSPPKRGGLSKTAAAKNKRRRKAESDEEDYNDDEMEVDVDSLEETVTPPRTKRKSKGKMDSSKEVKSPSKPKAPRTPNPDPRLKTRTTRTKTKKLQDSAIQIEDEQIDVEAMDDEALPTTPPLPGTTTPPAPETHLADEEKDRRPRRTSRNSSRRQTDAAPAVIEIVNLDDVPDAPDPEELPTSRRTRQQKAANAHQSVALCSYPKNAPNAITIHSEDLQRLISKTDYLNDTIIDAYLKYIEIQAEQLSEKKFYFFNSYFYRKLAENYDYERVKKWTKDVNIFSYDYIIIPVNHGFHWRLAVVCNCRNLNQTTQKLDPKDTPQVLLFDSLKKNKNILTKLKTYLTDEAAEKKVLMPKDFHFKKMRITVPQVPQQENDRDCGLFCLQYAECFVLRPIEDLDSKTLQAQVDETMPFEAESIQEMKRKHIKDLILEITSEQNLDLATLQGWNPEYEQGHFQRLTIQRLSKVANSPAPPSPRKPSTEKPNTAAITTTTTTPKRDSKGRYINVD